MNGETDEELGGWTVDTLKEYVDQRLADNRETIDKNEAFNAERFAASRKAVDTAFEAAKEAVLKSEASVEKRSDAVYVTLIKLQESLAAVMPRVEAEQRFKALNDSKTELKDITTTLASRREHDALVEKMNAFETRLTTTEGIHKGSDITMGKIYGAIAASVGLISIFIFLHDKFS